MSKSVNIGLIGCGKIAEISHIPAYRVLKKAQLVAVADTNGERAKWIAERFGIKEHYPDPMKIIEREDIDAVDICLPTYLHSEYILLASKAGKHIFCEKPMTLNVAEAEAALSSTNKSGVNLMVGFNQRFERPFMRIKEFINADLMGELMTLEVKYAKCESTDRYSPPNWRAYRSKGGGALLDSSCHKIDLMRWFAGDVSRVEAIDAHNLGGDAEDTIGLLLAFDQGAIGLLSSSLMCAFPHRELDSTNVFGSRGTAMYHSDRGKIVQLYIKNSLLGRTSGFLALDASSKKSSYILELEAFIDSIIKETKPPISGEDALKVHRIVQMAYESAGSVAL